MFAWHLEGLDEEAQEKYLADLYGPDTSVAAADKTARIERRRALALLHGGEVG